MATNLHVHAAPATRATEGGVLLPALIGALLMAPMFVSAVVFHTYDIAMGTLALEILRQLNAPFLVAEAVLIFAAWRQGFRPAELFSRTSRMDRAALLVFFACFWVGATFTSQIAPFAVLFNLTYVLHLVFLGAVFHLAAVSGPQPIAPFAAVMACGLVIFAAVILAKFLDPPAGRAIETIRWQFAIPGMISVRLFGAMLAPCVVLFVYLALSESSHRIKGIWTVAAAAFASGFLVWTGTRAGILGAAAALTIGLLCFRMEVLSRRFLMVLCACVGGALIGIALIPYGDPDFMLFVARDLTSANAATSGRLVWWGDLLFAYREFPVFGAGPGASSYILGSMHESHIQPHNLIIGFLLNWGFIATAAALFLVGRAHLMAHRAARRFRDVAPYVLMADCLLVIAFFDGTFHFAQHLMIWALVIALALAASRRQR